MYVRNRHFLNNIYEQFTNKKCSSSIFIVGYGHLVEKGINEDYLVSYSPLPEMVQNDRSLSVQTILVYGYQSELQLSDKKQKGIREFDNITDYIDLILK